MTRYKMVYDLIEEWIKELPWLDQFETKGKEKGRGKVAKRIVVARGVKDVVQFQEEIWRKKVEALGRLNVELEVGDDDDKSDDDTLSTTTGSSSSKRMQDLQEPRSSFGHTRKRPKTRHRELEEASQFLLNPLSSSLPVITDPSRPSSRFDPHTPATLTISPNSRSTTPPLLPLTSYLLASSASTLSLSHTPTRLQLLVAQRVGGAEDVGDDELFAEGELDDFLRSENEVERLKQVFGWEEGTDVVDELDTRKKTGKGQKSVTKRSGTTRVDMDALAKVLQGDLDEDKNDMQHPDFDITTTAGLEEIEEWRPLSPDPYAYFYDGMDRYDEEC